MTRKTYSEYVPGRPDTVFLQIALLGNRLEELGEKDLAGKITVFFLAVMPLPPQPTDPPPDVLERFIVAMRETISSDLEKLERIYLS